MLIIVWDCFSSRYVCLLEQLRKALTRTDDHEPAMKSLLENVQRALASVMCVEQNVTKSFANVSVCI